LFIVSLNFKEPTSPPSGPILRTSLDITESKLGFPLLLLSPCFLKLPAKAGYGASQLYRDGQVSTLALYVPLRTVDDLQTVGPMYGEVK
jgi:hypothetical protein